MSTQDILNIVLILALIVFTSCVVFITVFFVAALKAIIVMAENVSETTQSIKDKVQLKVLSAIPALLVTLVGKFIRRRG